MWGQKNLEKECSIVLPLFPDLINTHTHREIRNFKSLCQWLAACTSEERCEKHPFSKSSTGFFLSKRVSWGRCKNYPTHTVWKQWVIPGQTKKTFAFCKEPLALENAWSNQRKSKQTNSIPRRKTPEMSCLEPLSGQPPWQERLCG